MVVSKRGPLLPIRWKDAPPYRTAGRPVCAWALIAKRRGLCWATFRSTECSEGELRRTLRPHNRVPFLYFFCATQKDCAPCGVPYGTGKLVKFCVFLQKFRRIMANFLQMSKKNSNFALLIFKSLFL